MRREMKLMVLRKDLVRKGGDDNEAKAQKILEAVERSGGLTPQETMALQVY